jgi:ribA/ribD-fused uncharacterized protein
MNAITSFSGDYEFLSNFYSAFVIVDGLLYSTVEHAFQASKTLVRERREQIRNTRNTFRAKHMGRRVPLRPDWESIKIDVMHDLLRQKFITGRLRDLLVNTGDAELIEGNTWNDRFWGQCPVGVGENMLGKLIMQVRSEVSR